MLGVVVRLGVGLLVVADALATGRRQDAVAGGVVTMVVVRDRISISYELVASTDTDMGTAYKAAETPSGEGGTETAQAPAVAG